MDPFTVGAGISALEFGAGLWSDSKRSAQEKRAMRELLKGIEKSRGIYDQGFTEQMGMYDPYVEQGKDADVKYLEMINKFRPEDYYMPEMGEFNYDTSVDRFLDPSMDYQLQRAKEATEGSAAAAGGLLSGKALRDLQKEAQQFAQTDYGNAYNRMTGDRAFTYQDYLNRFNTERANIENKYNLFKDQLGHQTRLSDRGYNAVGAQSTITGNRTTAMADLAAQEANARARGQVINSPGQNFVNNLNPLVQGAGALYQGFSGSTSPTGPAMDMGMYSNYGPSYEGQGSSRPPYDYLNATGPDGAPLWMGL